MSLGEMLTADVSGIADADGLSNPKYRYQWIVSDGHANLVLPGETGAEYTVLPIDNPPLHHGAGHRHRRPRRSGDANQRADRAGRPLSAAKRGGRRLVQRPPTRRSAAVRSDGSTTAQGVR